jgi:alpha-beta hydrolase superfamily lysophospholipase
LLSRIAQNRDNHNLEHQLPDLSMTDGYSERFARQSRPAQSLRRLFQVTFDGMELRYAVFRSGSQFPKGTVVLLHGRNETIEKYFETIRDLNDMGLWVATFDWRGQGASPRLLKIPSRPSSALFRSRTRPRRLPAETIVLPDAKLPFFILGHSMGALVALKAAPRLANRIERMVLLAPFVGAVWHRHSGLAAEACSPTAPASSASAGPVLPATSCSTEPFAGTIS